MAYTNFKRTFWTEFVQRELAKALVAGQVCDKQYEGIIRKRGDRVKILGIGKPTISDFTGTLSDPETVEDTSIFLDIDKAKSFHFIVDDIDKAQSAPGVLDELTKEASLGLSEAADTDLLKLHSTGGEKITASNITSAVVLDKLSDALVKLWSNHVPKGTTVYAVVSPSFYKRVMISGIKLDTDNSQKLKTGYIGTYLGVHLLLSNNIQKKTTAEMIPVLTKNAIAYAGQINDVESYRPEKKFGDAVKGLLVYGTKIVRPKEVCWMECTYAAEQ